MTATFAGFPETALDFYEGLEADNSKAYWTEHRATYDDAVRAPMEALLAALADRLDDTGEIRVFRPYKDARRARGGALYKTHQGGFLEVHPGTGYYVQVSAAGLLVAAGWHPSGQQLVRYREAVRSPSGAQLDQLLGRLRSAGWRIDGGRELKRAPAGVSPDAPRIHLLRYRQLTAGQELGWPEWVGLPAAVDRIGALWLEVAPLLRWLVDHVGPGADEPRRR